MRQASVLTPLLLATSSPRFHQLRIATNTRLVVPKLDRLHQHMVKGELPMDERETTCFVPDELPLTARELEEQTPQDIALSILPIFASVIAFIFYEQIASLVTYAIDKGPGQWSAVDGGKAQVEMLQPVINGIVLPAVSIALGTLSATTISSLRDRQIHLRACLNKEAALLQVVFSACCVIFDGRLRITERQNALLLLSSYASRLVDESSGRGSRVVKATTGASDSELGAILRLFHRSPPIRDAVDAAGLPVPFHEGGLAGFAPVAVESVDPSAAGAVAHSAAGTHHALANAPSPPYTDVLEPRFFDGTQFSAQINLKEMLILRSDRLSLLQTTFPPVHWLVMALLGASIVLTFLLETDDQALQFLDVLQLRVSFTILAGTVSGIATICVDLNDPVRVARSRPCAQACMTCLRHAHAVTPHPPSACVSLVRPALPFQWQFRGSFRITPSAAQLCVIKALIEDELTQGCRVDMENEKDEGNAGAPVAERV